MRGVVLLVLALAGCEKQDSRPAEEPCLADHVGWLREWRDPGNCTRTPTLCRTACAGGDEDACFRLALEREWHDDSDASLLPSFRRGCVVGTGGARPRG